MDIDVDAILTKLLEVRGGKPGKNVDLTEAEIRGLIVKSRGILFNSFAPFNAKFFRNFFAAAHACGARSTYKNLWYEKRTKKYIIFK